jgi:hypothetical protein
MSATNSGVTPEGGFTYVNQLLFYARDEAKDDDGNTLPVTGEQSVIMDMNTLAWVSKKKVLAGARYSASVTIPIAKNNLTSDISQSGAVVWPIRTTCPPFWPERTDGRCGHV